MHDHGRLKDKLSPEQTGAERLSCDCSKHRSWPKDENDKPDLFR